MEEITTDKKDITIYSPKYIVAIYRRQVKLGHYFPNGINNKTKYEFDISAINAPWLFYRLYGR